MTPAVGGDAAALAARALRLVDEAIDASNMPSKLSVTTASKVREAASIFPILERDLRTVLPDHLRGSLLKAVTAVERYSGSDYHALKVVHATALDAYAAVRGIEHGGGIEAVRARGGLQAIDGASRVMAGVKLAEGHSHALAAIEQVEKAEALTHRLFIRESGVREFATATNLAYLHDVAATGAASGLDAGHLRVLADAAKLPAPTAFDQLSRGPRILRDGRLQHELQENLQSKERFINAIELAQNLPASQQPTVLPKLLTRTLGEIVTQVPAAASRLFHGLESAGPAAVRTGFEPVGPTAEAERARLLALLDGVADGVDMVVTIGMQRVGPLHTENVGAIKPLLEALVQRLRAAGDSPLLEYLPERISEPVAVAEARLNAPIETGILGHRQPDARMYEKLADDLRSAHTELAAHPIAATGPASIPTEFSSRVNDLRAAVDALPAPIAELDTVAPSPGQMQQLVAYLDSIAGTTGALGRALDPVERLAQAGNPALLTRREEVLEPTREELAMRLQQVIDAPVGAAIPETERSRLAHSVLILRSGRWEELRPPWSDIAYPIRKLGQLKPPNPTTHPVRFALEHATAALAKPPATPTTGDGMVALAAEAHELYKSLVAVEARGLTPVDAVATQRRAAVAGLREAIDDRMFAIDLGMAKLEQTLPKPLLDAVAQAIADNKARYTIRVLASLDAVINSSGGVPDVTVQSGVVAAASSRIHKLAAAARRSADTESAEARYVRAIAALDATREIAESARMAGRTWEVLRAESGIGLAINQLVLAKPETWVPIEQRMEFLSVVEQLQYLRSHLSLGNGPIADAISMVRSRVVELQNMPTSGLFQPFDAEYVRTRLTSAIAALDATREIAESAPLAGRTGEVMRAEWGIELAINQLVLAKPDTWAPIEQRMEFLSVVEQLQYLRSHLSQGNGPIADAISKVRSRVVELQNMPTSGLFQPFDAEYVRTQLASAREAFAEASATSGDYTRIVEALEPWKRGVRALDLALASTRELLPKEVAEGIVRDLDRFSWQVERASTYAGPVTRGRIFPESMFPQQGLAGQLRSEIEYLDELVANAAANPAGLSHADRVAIAAI